MYTNSEGTALENGVAASDTGQRFTPLPGAGGSRSALAAGDEPPHGSAWACYVSKTKWTIPIGKLFSLNMENTVSLVNVPNLLQEGYPWVCRKKTRGFLQIIRIQWWCASMHRWRTAISAHHWNFNTIDATEKQNLLGIQRYRANPLQDKELKWPVPVCHLIITCIRRRASWINHHKPSMMVIHKLLLVNLVQNRSRILISCW